MREAILIKTGEIALKGLNRHTFEQILVKNIRFRLKKFGKVNITKSQSTIRVEPKEENMDSTLWPRPSARFSASPPFPGPW